VRLRLFWQLSLTSFALLLAVLLAGDLYTAGLLRRDYLRADFERLEAFARIAEARPPQLPAAADSPELHTWVSWMAASGARITIIATDGRVLADSAEDPRRMENHAGRPEIREAFASGEGRAVRHSATINRDLVYFAVRHQAAGEPSVVLRFALPLQNLDEALAHLRTRLWAASLVILLVAGGASLLISRSLAARVKRLETFSRRVAEGDFHPVAVERAGDELGELTRALNETAAHLDDTIRSLTDERNRSAAILRSMVEGVAVISAEERMVFCNTAFSQVLGVDASSCAGRRPVEVIRQPELLDAIGRVLSAGQTVQTEVTVGTVRPRTFGATAAPITGLEGEAEPSRRAGVVLVLHDISELRRLERVRRDFVANVSHEFKTPLTAIQGFAETLLAGALDDLENRQRFLEIIRDHAHRLARLTDDLLELSRIEAGKMELELRAVSAAEIIPPCIETARLKAAAKQLSLDAECPMDLPAARGDARRLQQVLQNLLDNAVQYTLPGGRIIVRARADAGNLVITVSDTGIGIPQAEQERIFERFYRVDAARSRDVGGTGLGLAIAKHIVEAHSGRIWVESAVGTGSDFHFRVPLL